MKKRLLTRTEVRKVKCPMCGAEKNERCTGAKGQVRESNHAERVRLAR